MPRNHFDVLGVPRVFHLSSDELERKYLELSRQVHPDKFAKAEPRERLAALQKSTELNDAYKVLRDPVRRAEYLLKLDGLDIGDERGAVKAEPALLMEMMELNEELADARAAGDLPTVARLAADVRARRAAALATVDQGFRAVDGGDAGPRSGIAQALIAMRYHSRFLEQADAAESGELFDEGSR